VRTVSVQAPNGSEGGRQIDKIAPRPAKVPPLRTSVKFTEVFEDYTCEAGWRIDLDVDAIEDCVAQRTPYTNPHMVAGGERFRKIVAASNAPHRGGAVEVAVVISGYKGDASEVGHRAGGPETVEDACAKRPRLSGRVPKIFSKVVFSPG